MKVRINYRALCPYDTAPDGTECYHWYTDELETDQIRYTSGGVEIHQDGVSYSWYAHEQINLMTVTD